MTSKRERATSAPPVKRKRESNGYMWRPPSTGERVRVHSMSERETIDKEMAEAIAMMKRANRAIDRIFNTEEGEEENE